MYYQLPIDFATIREEMKNYMNVSREAVLNIPSNYTSKKDKIESYIPFHISGQNCLKVGGHSRMSKKEQITVALYIETYIVVGLKPTQKYTDDDCKKYCC